MQENKEKLAFSSVSSENSSNVNATPKVAVNNAFEEERIRQTQEIPVQAIQQAAKMETELLDTAVPNQQLQQNQITQQPETQNYANSPSLYGQQQKTVQQSNNSNGSNVEIKEKHHMKRGVKIALIFLILMFAFSFAAYKTYTYFNDPKNISKKSLINIGEEFSKILNIGDEATLIGDNYSIESTINTQLESQKIMEEYLTNQDSLEKYNLLMNLNNTTTNISLIQDLKNKKFFYNSKTALKTNNNIIINDKYLIDNSTEYYFVQNFFNTYVNDGNNNYFETLTEDQNAIYNIKYIYKQILLNIASCIDLDDYTVVNTTTYLNNQTQRVKKISVKLDNVKIRKVLNKLIATLKKDKTAFNILNGVIDDFANYKLSTKNKFIENNETITFNFYTQGLLNDTKKYEVILIGPKTSKAITYEIDNKLITILNNYKVKYYIDYSLNTATLSLNIKDKSNKKIGSVVFDNSKTRKHLTVEFDDSTYDASIDVNYKVTDRKKSSYNSSITSTINIKENNKNVLSGNINVNTKVNKETKIDESVKDVVFSSEITDAKHDELKNLLKNRLKQKIYN